MEIKCKFCESDTDKIFENGVQCKRCRSVQVITMPSDEVINDYYLLFNENYHGGGPAVNQIKYAIQYLKLVRKYIKSFKTILDVGCSNSPFPNLANRCGVKVSVLDVVKPSNLDDQIEYYNGLLDNGFNIPENLKFDVITAWAVIEHVKNVDVSFENISSALNDNGYLFLTTPEIGTTLSNYNLGKTPWFFPPEHLHVLSPKCMINIAAKYNLELVSWGHFEISRIRYFIRYYVIGLSESLLGILIYTVSKTFFKNIKLKRVSSFKGIQYLVFKKK